MTERERLVELVKDSEALGICGCHYNDVQRFACRIADYFLENGVIVPLCKVGDTVYVVWFSDDSQNYKMAKHKVTDISTKYIWFDGEELFYPLTAIGEEVFFTKEEVETRLKVLRKEDEGNERK